MSNVNYDIEMTSKIINKRSWSSYCKVYFASNEELKSIFSNFNFEGKDILTVVGSGDQAFYFYNALAKRIDLFDINKLSFYYYFLRTWIINIYGTFYPEIDRISDEYFDKLLNNVKPSCDLERDALSYWKMFIDKYDSSYFYEILFYCSTYTMNINEISDLSIIRKKMNGFIPDFYNVDIANKNEIKKKYDVIYTSNIVEYVYRDGNITAYRDNLYDLLNDNGIVIKANYAKYGAFSNELKIFDEKFFYKELPKVKISSRSYEESPGYVYTKRK